MNPWWSRCVHRDQRSVWWHWRLNRVWRWFFVYNVELVERCSTVEFVSNFYGHAPQLAHFPRAAHRCLHSSSRAPSSSCSAASRGAFKCIALTMWWWLISLTVLFCVGIDRSLRDLHAAVFSVAFILWMFILASMLHKVRIIFIDLLILLILLMIVCLSFAFVAALLSQFGVRFWRPYHSLIHPHQNGGDLCGAAVRSHQEPHAAGRLVVIVCSYHYGYVHARKCSETLYSLKHIPSIATLLNVVCSVLSISANMSLSQLPSIYVCCSGRQGGPKATFASTVRGVVASEGLFALYNGCVRVCVQCGYRDTFRN